jgi:cytoskeletal protein RodZ
MEEFIEFLKAERSKRDVGLETISSRSGISLSMLLAFESGDLEAFGASVLIRNTIKAYCEVLETEAGPLIEKFAAQIEKHNIQARGIKKFGQQMKILHKKRRMISAPLLVLVITSVAVFYGGMWVAEKRTKMYAPPAADRIFTQEELPAELQQKLGPASKAIDSEHLRQASPPDSGIGLREADNAIRDADLHLSEAEQVKKDQKTLDEEIAKQTTAGNAQTGRQENVPPKLALSNSTEAVADDRPTQATETLQKCKLIVEADDKVWIQVKIDDKGTRSAMLRPGDKMEWVAEKSMQVVVGNAGGIRMKWNDQPVPTPRDPGRVLRFRLPDYLADAG